MLHIFVRDTGELIGAITPQDVGAALQPIRNVEAGGVQPPPANGIIAGPWPERWLLTLPAVPLVIWLVWQLSRRWWMQTCPAKEDR
jgi:hypothetical protein